VDIISLGKIVSAVPGTLVPLTTDATIRVHELVVSQIPGNAGLVYLVNTSLINGTYNATSGIGVVRPFLKVSATATGIIDEHHVRADNEANPFKLADFAVDAATAADGLYVYAIRR
jgi:hypothetical protein